MQDFCSILNNAQHLHTLRVRILDTTLIQSNQIQITKVPQNLEHLLFICLHAVSYHTIKDIFQRLISLKKLSFALVFDTYSGAIDGYRLHDDIFIHLINAVIRLIFTQSLIFLL